MPKKTLIIMRHAKSSWKTNDSDLKRPLSGRGCRDAVVAGQVLANLKIDLAKVSPATRAQQTWECANMGGARAAKVLTDETLYEEGPAEIMAQLAKTPDKLNTVLLLGHEPTLSEIIMAAVSPAPLAEKVSVKFPTCAIAVITAPDWDSFKEEKAHLIELSVPRGKRKKDKKTKKEKK